MTYTIEDLAEGKCAVINDGTLEELREVLRMAIGGMHQTVSGAFKNYLCVPCKSGKTTHGTDNDPEVPTQSVKDFLYEKSTIEAFKPEQPIDKITVDLLDAALKVCNINIKKPLLDDLIDVFELLLDKGDNTTLQDLEKLKESWK